MNRIIVLILLLSCIACKETSVEKKESINTNDFVIAFGSCNDQKNENTFWKEIEKHEPSLWLWGGDIIYSDTYDMEFLEQNYAVQKSQKDYANFISKTAIMGTWDDHDYGINDGGAEYPKKAESQQLFLDFIGVDNDSSLRNRAGVYTSKSFQVNDKVIKVIILDTRYHRTALTNNDDGTYKRYKPNPYGEGTILGDEQWQWLQSELTDSKADFHIIMSSIQILSGEHGWETWANMPHEVDKLTQILVDTNAKNTILLSGDRHISDFSKMNVKGLNYPLIDFTSSGLTHSSTRNKGEPNQYRVGNMVNQKSFGLLKFNLGTNTVLMEMRGEENLLQQSHTQKY